MNAPVTPRSPRARGPLRVVGVLAALAVLPVAAGTAGVASAAIAQAITFTSDAPTGAIVGGAPYIPSATGGDSGNPVTFSIATASAGICALSGGQVSFTGAGSCVVNANQSGGGSYAPAPQVSQTFGTCVVSALTSTCTLTFTGTVDAFTIPPNISVVDVVATGGGGGSGEGVGSAPRAVGGGGAVVSVVGLPAIPDDEVVVTVGGGGAGGWAGGGGGSTNVGTLVPDPDSIIAGGGGGGGMASPAAADNGKGGDGGAGGLAAGGPGTQGADAVALPGSGGADGTGGTGGAGNASPLSIAGANGGTGEGGAGAHRYPNDGGGGFSTPGALGLGGAGGSDGNTCSGCFPDGGSGGGGYGGGGGGSSHGGGGGAGGSFGPTPFVAATSYATAPNGGTNGSDGLSGSVTFTFARQGGLLAFATQAPSPAAVGGTYTPDAAGAPSGQQVTLSVDGASAGVCTLSAGVVSFIGAGTCSVVADQGGTLSYRPDQVTQSFEVGKLAQLVTFTSIAPQAATVGGAPYVPTATGGASGQPVTLGIDPASAAVCQMAGDTVRFAAPGTCTVTANQAGNGTFLAAPSATQSFAVSGVPASPTGGPVTRQNIRRSAQSPNGMVTVFLAPGPGEVSQAGLAATSSNGRVPNAVSRRVVCTGALRVRAAGPVRVTCTLTPAGRRALRAQALRVRLVTAFTPTGGTTTRVTTTASLARRPATRRLPVTG